MSKRNRQRKRKKKHQKTRQQTVMTQEDVSNMILFLERMTENMARAVNLSETLTLDDLTGNNPSFWALVKLVENVQESATQIDNTNKKLFPELIEHNEQDWNLMRKMRNILVHEFWQIDPVILWESVNNHFAKLLPLLRNLRIHNQIVTGGDEFQFNIKGDQLLGLAEWPEDIDTEPVAGQSVVCVAFDINRDVTIVRVGIQDKQGTPKLVTRATTTLGRTQP